MEFDVASMSGRNIYKLLASVIVPRPIAFITSQNRDGLRNAAPFSYFNIMGSAPPIVAVGIGNLDREGNPKHTGRNIRQTGEFVVNMVSEEILEIMNHAAVDFPDHIDEINEIGIDVTPSATVKPPRITASPVHLECVEVTTIERGRTRVVLGEVVHFAIRDDLVDEERLRVNVPAAHLVGRMHGSGGYVRTTDLVTVPRLNWQSWQLRQQEGDTSHE